MDDMTPFTSKPQTKKDTPTHHCFGQRGTVSLSCKLLCICPALVLDCFVFAAMKDAETFATDNDDWSQAVSVRVIVRVRECETQICSSFQQFLTRIRVAHAPIRFMLDGPSAPHFGAPTTRRRRIWNCCCQCHQQS